MRLCSEQRGRGAKEAPALPGAWFGAGRNRVSIALCSSHEGGSEEKERAQPRTTPDLSASEGVILRWSAPAPRCVLLTRSSKCGGQRREQRDREGSAADATRPQRFLGRGFVLVGTCASLFAPHTKQRGRGAKEGAKRKRGLSRGRTPDLSASGVLIMRGSESHSRWALWHTDACGAFDR